MDPGGGESVERLIILGANGQISLRIFDQVHNSAPKSRESITNQSSRSRIQHWCHNATHDRTVTSRLRAISESSPCHV
ncbi:hypothetical protein M8J75_009106 [Diaphorina citri]|nr:hypothetical protein M8J75_009106 [Diaphorina citri]